MVTKVKGFSLKSCRVRFYSAFYSISGLVVIGLIPQVSAAPPTVDGSTTTTVTAATNGVPIVNIAKQNADGVSRNAFTDFSVDPQGLILNNADNIGVSTLGGAILGNTNFAAGDGARIILNEVTSNQISNLNGYVETFGKQAEFILANPNGITCNGCGFINTSRATLITGSETNKTGAVGVFGLGAGSVTFSGAGLNGDNLSFLEIISRAAIIQAEIRATSGLAIKTGNSEYDYASKTVSSNATAATGFAIDASLLGSMYAGQIELITTEAGVGVRSLGTLNGLQQVTIDSSGNVETAAISGSTLSIKAAATLTQNGLYTAKDLIQLDANALTLTANIESDNNITVNAVAGNITVSGAIKGGTGSTTLNASAGDLTLIGSVFSAGSISLTAMNVLNQNQLAARGGLTVNATTNLTNEAGKLIFSGADLILNVDGTITNAGDLYAMGNLTAQNQNGVLMRGFTNNGGRVESLGNLTIKAAKITNTHGFADNLAPSTSTQVDKPAIRIDTAAVSGIATWNEQVNPNLKRGLIQSGGNMILDAGNAGVISNNLSDIYSSGDLTMNAGTINNTAYILQEAIKIDKKVWGVVGKKRTGLFRRVKRIYGWIVTPTQQIQDTTNSIGASIQSGGLLTMTTPATGVINNSVPIAGNIQGASFNGSVGDPLAGISLPGVGGFFKPNPAPSKDQPYLIETDPALIDLSKLFGSEYFLDRIGVGDSGDDQLFLGDAFYEQRLIADQIRLLTGQRYLLNAKDDNEQYQQLADAAANERERLGLKLGEALSLEQQDQLQENILWYVETTVGDKMVLVPRLYLSKATRTLVADNKGALIKGQDVVLHTGNLMNEGAIISETALSINTEDQVLNAGGTIIAGTELTIASKGNITSESILSYATLGADIRESVTRVAKIKSGGTLDLLAEGDIELLGSELDSAGDTTLSAKGDLSLTALKLENKRNWRDSGGNWNYTNTKIEHATSKLKSDGNLVLSSVGELLIEGADIIVKGDAKLVSESQIQMLAVKNTDVTVGTYYKKKTWSKTTGRSRTSETRYKNANLNATKTIALSSIDDTTIVASNLSAEGDLNLHSESGNIAIIAAVDSNFEQRQMSKKGFSYKKKNGQGQLVEQLNAATLNSGRHISFTTGDQLQQEIVEQGTGTILVAGSLIKSAGNMVFGGTTIVNDSDASLALTATDASRINNLIFDTVALNNKSWRYSEKKARGLGIVAKVFTGGELLRKDKVATATTEQIGTNAISGGDFVANTQEDIVIKAGTIEAKGDGRLDALGDVEIIAAINRITNYEEQVRAKASGISFDWDGSRASVGINADYNKKVMEQTRYLNQGSIVNVGGDLTVTGEDILIAGSTLKTSSTLTIDAKNALSVMSVDDILERADKTTKAAARLSVGVGNAYLDFAQSLGKLKDAKRKVKDAKRALAAFNAELKQMQADLEKDLVTEDDIRLRKQDRKYFKANITLAKVNLVNTAVSVTATGARIVAAAATSYGTGFYADVKLELSGSKTTKTQYQSNSIASNLIALKDMNLNAGESINVRGSDIQVQNELTMIAGEDVFIEAAKNTYSSDEKTKSFNAQMSYGTSGASGGIKEFAKVLSKGSNSWSAGINKGFDKNRTTTWRNSRIKAGEKITIKSDNNTDIVGANVIAKNINVQTGGDLTVQSRQNTLYSRGKSMGVTVGSGSSGLTAGRSRQDRRWVDDLTTLIGTESVTIENKGKTKLIGAMIAQIDKDNVDSGKLSIKTSKFIQKDLIDYDNSSQWKAGFSTSLLGVSTLNGSTKNKTAKQIDTTKTKNNDFLRGTSSVQLSNGGYVRGQKTLATLGKGAVSGWDDKPVLLASLNRDIDSVQIVTANRKTGGLNVDVTIDHRILSKKGWQDIAKDAKATFKTFKTLAGKFKKKAAAKKPKPTAKQKDPEWVPFPKEDQENGHLSQEEILAKKMKEFDQDLMNQEIERLRRDDEYYKKQQLAKNSAPKFDSEGNQLSYDPDNLPPTAKSKNSTTGEYTERTYVFDEKTGKYKLLPKDKFVWEHSNTIVGETPPETKKEIVSDFWGAIGGAGVKSGTQSAKSNTETPFSMDDFDWLNDCLNCYEPEVTTKNKQSASTSNFWDTIDTTLDADQNDCINCYKPEASTQNKQQESTSDFWDTIGGEKGNAKTDTQNNPESSAWFSESNCKNCYTPISIETNSDNQGLAWDEKAFKKSRENYVPAWKKAADAEGKKYVEYFTPSVGLFSRLTVVDMGLRLLLYSGGMARDEQLPADMERGSTQFDFDRARYTNFNSWLEKNVDKYTKADVTKWPAWQQKIVRAPHHQLYKKIIKNSKSANYYDSNNYLKNQFDEQRYQKLKRNFKFSSSKPQIYDNGGLVKDSFDTSEPNFDWNSTTTKNNTVTTRLYEGPVENPAKQGVDYSLENSDWQNLDSFTDEEFKQLTSSSFDPINRSQTGYDYKSSVNGKKSYISENGNRMTTTFPSKGKNTNSSSKNTTRTYVTEDGNKVTITRTEKPENDSDTGASDIYVDQNGITTYDRNMIIGNNDANQNYQPWEIEEFFGQPVSQQRKNPPPAPSNKPIDRSIKYQDPPCPKATCTTLIVRGVVVAKIYASTSGANKEDKTDYLDRQFTRQEILDLFGTREGQKMLAKIIKEKTTLKIFLNHQGVTNSTGYGKMSSQDAGINIDTQNIPQIKNKLGQWFTPSPMQVLAHEMGHETNNTREYSKKNKWMNNVRTTETPMLKDMGYGNEVLRACYFCDKKLDNMTPKQFETYRIKVEEKQRQQENIAYRNELQSTINPDFGLKSIWPKATK